MQSHVERMFEELTQLNERTDRLCTFIGGDVFQGLPIQKRELMRAQLSAMLAYRNVLDARFKLEKEESP